MTDRPNILCLVSEDCPVWLGPYGDRVARTPTLDRLAAEGVTWDVACCTAPVCAPSRFAILTGRHAPSVPPAQHMTAWGPTPAGIVTYPQMMRAAGYYCTNNAKTHYNCDIDPEAIWDETSGKAHWANRPAGTPFLAVFNTMLTHESCMFETREGAVQPADVTVPANLPDLPGIRRVMASYYNRIEEMDAFMAARLAELDAAGLAEDTIVFYHSDHASPLPRSKRFCYDDGLNVPLIVRVPEKWRHLLPLAPGSRVAAPASLIDLMQTFAAIAGCAPPEGVQGRSLFGPGRGHAFSSRDRMDEHHDMTRTARGPRYRYIRNYAPHRIWGMHYAFAWNGRAYQDYEAAHLAGTLTPGQDRFWHAKPAEELYDMQADPAALSNLAGDAAHAAKLDEARAALDAHMLAIHDCGFIPEGSPVQDYAASRDPALYPLPEVMALAALAIARDPAEAPGFVAALGHASPVMRYWGAQGLLILACAGHALPGGLRARLDAESDPHVRIALLEALGHAGDGAAEVAALTALAAGEAPAAVRLQALNALCWLPLHPDLSLESMRVVATDPDEYVRGVAGYLVLKLEGRYTPDAKIFRFDLYTSQGGHTGIGPQSFPSLDSLKARA